MAACPRDLSAGWVRPLLGGHPQVERGWLPAFGRGSPTRAQSPDVIWEALRLKVH